MGSGGIAPPFLTSALDGGEYQLHASADIGPIRAHIDLDRCLSVKPPNIKFHENPFRNLRDKK
jgi:hypothetical protein